MRRTNYTISLVGEGAGDCQLVVHIRDLFLHRFCGVALTIKNARGFGGRHALGLALELKAVGAHDAYGVMIDTDRLWGDEERRVASQAGIVVIENNPSLEATLLKSMAVQSREQPLKTSEYLKVDSAVRHIEPV